MNPKKLAARYLLKTSAAFGTLDYAIDQWLGEKWPKFKDQRLENSLPVKPVSVDIHGRDGLTFEFTWVAPGQDPRDQKVLVLVIRLHSDAARGLVSGSGILFIEGLGFEKSIREKKMPDFTIKALADNPVQEITRGVLSFVANQVDAATVANYLRWL